MAQQPTLRITNRIKFEEDGLTYLIVVYCNCLYRGVLYTGDSEKPIYISKIYVTEYDALIILKKYVKNYLQETK